MLKSCGGDNYDMFLVKKKDEKAMQNVTSFALLSLEKGKKNLYLFPKGCKSGKSKLNGHKKGHDW